VTTSRRKGEEWNNIGTDAGMETRMIIRLICGVLIVAALALTVPPTLSVAQSDDQTVSALQGGVPTVTPFKHRYWRHRGGRHPHYGSRRVRAYAPAAAGQLPASR
jgi:hypothetical protein